MHRRVLAVFLTGILLTGTLLTGAASGHWPRVCFPRLSPVPKAPALSAHAPPEGGPRPYYGQALGATYYNWGYFGAHQHAQLTTHGGYYGEYRQHGHARGY